MTENQTPIKMCIAGERKRGFTDAQFIHEFTVVHAQITKASATKTPPLLNYRQILAVPKPSIHPIFSSSTTDHQSQHATTSWDSQAILEWSSIGDLSSVLKSEGYRANAGKHIFTEPPRLGSICQVAGDLMLDPVSYQQQDQEQLHFMVFIYIPRASKTKTNRDLLIPEPDLAHRLDTISRIASQRTGLMRYVINRDVGPSDPSQLFDGTPFITCEWGAMGATEQYWFKDEETARDFFEDGTVREALTVFPGSLDGKGCVCIAGMETVLVSK